MQPPGRYSLNHYYGLWPEREGLHLVLQLRYTFFDKYDFSGKTIIPFNTHMGSGDGGTYDTIRELDPKAIVLTGLPVEMRDAKNGPAKAVEKWLKSLD
jgi:flavodoxin